MVTHSNNTTMSTLTQRIPILTLPQSPNTKARRTLVTHTITLLMIREAKETPLCKLGAKVKSISTSSRIIEVATATTLTREQITTSVLKMKRVLFSQFYFGSPLLLSVSRSAKCTTKENSSASTRTTLSSMRN